MYSWCHVLESDVTLRLDHDVTYALSKGALNVGAVAFPADPCGS